MKKNRLEKIEGPELAEKWIVDTNGEIIGGTYIKKYGWDFTSIKTGVRYIGRDKRTMYEIICSAFKGKLRRHQ